MKGKREESLLWEIIAALTISPVKLVLCQLDALWRRKGRTLQADCPKHKMQSTARDCPLNQDWIWSRNTGFHSIYWGKCWCVVDTIFYITENRQNEGYKMAPQLSVKKECCSRNFTQIRAWQQLWRQRSSGCFLCMLLPDRSHCPQHFLFPLTAHPDDVMLSKTKYKNNTS